MFNKKYIILYLILLYLFARLYLLFAGLESLIAPYPDDNELYCGTTAKMYIDGFIDSLLYFQRIDYNGISTVESLVAIPFFYVFGPYLFSLKLVALTFLLATMVLWFFFVKRHISFEAAIITALLFIFAPPSFISYNLTCGFHSTPLFFDILAITFFFKMIRNTPSPFPLPQGERTKVRGLNWHVLFGIASGFSLWVDNVFAITLITCMVFWFIHDKKFFLKRTFAIFVISFLAGFSIWFYYVIFIRHFHIMNIFEYSSHYTKTVFYKKFLQTLAYKLPYSLSFKDYFFSGVFLNYLYYAIFVIAFLGLIWFQRKSILKTLSSFLPARWQGEKAVAQGGQTIWSAATMSLRNRINTVNVLHIITVESFFLGYIVIFILAFSFSHFDVGYKSNSPWEYRFFIPLYPFIFVTIAIGLNKLLNTGRNTFKFIPCILIFILISAGIMGLVSQTSIMDFGKGLTFKGYSYRALQAAFGRDFIEGIKMANRIDDGRYKNYLCYCYGFVKLAMIDKLELSECETLIRNVEEPVRPNCYEGVGYGYGVIYSDASTVLEKLRLTNLTDKRYEKYFLYGVANSLPIQDTVDRHTFFISQFDSQFQPYLYQGLGIQLARRLGLADVDGILLQVDEVNKKYCCIGVGQNFARRLEWAFADKKYPISFDGLNKDYWTDCYYGLGWGIGDFFEFDMDRYLPIINNNVLPEYMEYCFKGLADRLRWKFGNNYRILNFVPAIEFVLDNNTIKFNDESQRKYLVKGWSSTEEWGTWSEGEESVILVNFKGLRNEIASSASGGLAMTNNRDYIMHIKATGFSVPGKQQSVKIYLDDNLLGEHTFSHPVTYFEDFEVKIPKAYIKEGSNQRIRFVYSFTGRPVDHEMGPDLRQLAMGVSSIEFK